MILNYLKKDPSSAPLSFRGLESDPYTVCQVQNQLAKRSNEELLSDRPLNSDHQLAGQAVSPQAYQTGGTRRGLGGGVVGIVVVIQASHPGGPAGDY